MNSTAIALLSLCAAGLLFLPRRWAVLPLLAGACFTTVAQMIDLGPFSFTVTRSLVAVGAIRVLLRGERLHSGWIPMDRVIVVWALWACASSLFHNEPKTDVITKLGQSYDALGIYFLLRIFCHTFEDVLRLSRATVLVLLPVASAMLLEHIVGRNYFSIFGGVHELPMVRDGRIRSTGPFMHPILAGTVGAVSLPLMVGLWRFHRASAWMGGVACLAMVVTSNSSGPVMSALSALAALCLWPYRLKMQTIRRAAVAAYIVLDIVMKAPAYYLIAHIDITGSSTGWHRAALIEAAFQHLNEWWLTGTDYTRHWMPTGVSWSPDHTDITNHYLHMGVMGGLPLMGLFIALLACGFSCTGKTVRVKIAPRERFLAWALGAVLFAHATTFISVSYFDQSVLFLYVVLAAAGSVASAAVRRRPAGARARHDGTPDRGTAEGGQNVPQPAQRALAPPAV